MINAGRCGSVNVVPRAEVFNHALVAAQLRHDAEFNLRIVGREKRTPLLWHKSLADFAPVIAANRNVLQVGIARREASCGRHSLVERRMDVSCLRINQFRQRINIRADELFQRTVGKNLPNDGMLGAQGFQDLLPR